MSKKEELNEDSGSAHCTDAPVHSSHVSGGASEGAADTASETSSRRTPSPLEPSLASAETAGGPEPPENDGRPTHEATLQHAEGEGEGPDLSPRIPDPGIFPSHLQQRGLQHAPALPAAVVTGCVREADEPSD